MMLISGSNRRHFSVLFVLICVFLLANAAAVFAAGGGITVIPDESLFIQIVNFLFLIWAMNILLYRPIRNVLIQRKEKFASLGENIETLTRDAQEKDDAFAEGLKEARAQGLKEKEVFVQAASEEEKEIIAKINQKAQADLEEVRTKIAKDVEAARTSLQKEVDTFADAIGEKILGRAI
jgi:F-type H+-transporting ATPase subunit b